MEKRAGVIVLLGVLVILFVGINAFLITAMSGMDYRVVSERDDLTTKKSLSFDEVKFVALNAFPGVVDEVEIEEINGEIFYEVDVLSNGEEIEVMIDRNTGNIVSFEVEEDEKIPSSEIRRIDGLISEERAIEIALERIGEARFLNFVSEKEGGKIIHEVELRTGIGEKVEVEIDAETGNILEIEYGDD